MYCLTRRAVTAPARTYRAPAPTSGAVATLTIASERPAHAERTADGPGETAALLEAAAIALGAADLSPERIGIARAADRALRTYAHDVPAAARMARLFHHTLLTACPNRHMLDLIESAAPHRRVHVELPFAELSRVVDDHEAILDMIASGAPPAELERCLRRHTSSSPLCAFGGA